MNNKETRYLSQDRMWVNIEGTDAVGKTRLSKELLAYLKNQYPNLDFELMDEFSNSSIGQLIRDVINDKTFFMLGDQGHLPISETLLLSSDFFAQREPSISYNNNQQVKKGLVLSDRGIYSFLAYQGMRLRNVYGENIDWNQWIKNIFSPLKYPDVTICLTSPIDQIEHRLLERGDKVTSKSLEFIRQAQDEFLVLGGENNSHTFLAIENLNGKFDKTLNKAKKIISGFLE